MGGDNKRKAIDDSSNDQKKTKAALNGMDWRKEHSITIHAPDSATYAVPEPMLSFEDTPFSSTIKNSLIHAGFSSPTNTQAQSWPIALSKRDLISVARTGSGKTVGFLLPCFHHLNPATLNKRGAAPQILVLAPTRELATQIEQESRRFGKPNRIRSTCVYGGAPKSIQIRALQNGVECLIATPGRLNDLIQMNRVSLKNVKMLVLDEADRMLDMGFEPQIRSIIQTIPPSKTDPRQTLLFSATWPKSIQRLANEFLTRPIQVNMGQVNVLHANQDITQNIQIMSEKDKAAQLGQLLQKCLAQPSDMLTHPKTIIFFRTKRVCDRLANEYWDKGFASDALHGDKEQWQRTKTMQEFKAGKTKLLFATDVAARGLDVKDVEIVINFDMPDGRNGIEDYVHRIGRTGRAGAKGTAYSFMTNEDSACVNKLIEILKNAKQDIPSDLYDLKPQRNQKHHGGRRFGRGGNRRNFSKRW